MVVRSLLVLALVSSCEREALLTTQEVVRPVRTMSLGIAPESGRRAFPGQAETNEEADLYKYASYDALLKREGIISTDTESLRIRTGVA